MRCKRSTIVSECGTFVVFLVEFLMFNLHQMMTFWMTMLYLCQYCEFKISYFLKSYVGLPLLLLIFSWTRFLAVRFLFYFMCSHLIYLYFFYDIPCHSPPDTCSQWMQNNALMHEWFVDLTPLNSMLFCSDFTCIFFSVSNTHSF